MAEEALRNGIRGFVNVSGRYRMEVSRLRLSEVESRTELIWGG